MSPAFLQHPAGVAQRLRDRDLIGQERQVHEHQRAVRAPAYRGGVINHLIQRGAQRRAVTSDHLVDRVPDQQQVHDRVEHSRRERVVTGENDDLPPLALGIEQVADGEGAGLGVGHAVDGRWSMVNGRGYRWSRYSGL